MVERYQSKSIISCGKNPMKIKDILKLLQTFTYNWWELFKYINYDFPQRGMMQIRIHCRKCKDESLLKTQKILTLEQAKETIHNITEVIKRHESHPNHLDFYVFDDADETDMKHYIYNALNNRIKKHVHK